MASASSSDNVSEPVQEEKQSLTVHMESIGRLMKFPIVKRIASVITTVYTKMKDNSAASRTLASAESIAKTAVSTASPLLATFQKPLEKVDSLLCSGIDYVESNIPVVTKDPDQILNYISETRPVKMLRNIPEYSKQKIVDTSLVSQVQLALSGLKPYFTLKTYPENLNVYDFIAKKINELFLSGLTEEVADKDNTESTESTANDETQKTAEESQPEQKSGAKGKCEGTNEKAVEKAN